MRLFILHNQEFFLIRVFGIRDEQDIVNCFQDYEGIFEANFDNQKFSFIISLDERRRMNKMDMKIWMI